MPKQHSKNPDSENGKPAKTGADIHSVPLIVSFSAAESVLRSLEPTFISSTANPEPNDIRCVGVWVQQSDGPILVVASFYAVEVQQDAFSHTVFAELSHSFSPDVLAGVRVSPASAQEFLVDQLLTLIDTQKSSIHEAVQSFARWSFALLGAANYIFDTTSSVVELKTYNDIELVRHMDTIPLDRTVYVGVMPPKLISELGWRSKAASVEHALPSFNFKEYDTCTFREVSKSASQLRSAFRAVLEPLVRNAFRTRFDGDLRIYFGQSEGSDTSILAFLKNLNVVWYPDWQLPLEHDTGHAWQDISGMLLVQISGGEYDTEASWPPMDETRSLFVEQTMQLVEGAIDFLACNLSRWAQRLSPYQAADNLMSADDLVSAMNFLYRTMPKLAKYLGGPVPSRRRSKN